MPFPPCAGDTHGQGPCGGARVLGGRGVSSPSLVHVGVMEHRFRAGLRAPQEPCGARVLSLLLR